MECLLVLPQILTAKCGHFEAFVPNFGQIVLVLAYVDNQVAYFHRSLVILLIIFNRCDEFVHHHAIDNLQGELGQWDQTHEKIDAQLALPESIVVLSFE